MPTDRATVTERDKEVAGGPLAYLIKAYCQYWHGMAYEPYRREHAETDLAANLATYRESCCAEAVREERERLRLVTAERDAIQDEYYSEQERLNAKVADHDSARQSEKERADYAEGQLAEERERRERAEADLKALRETDAEILADQIAKTEALRLAEQRIKELEEQERYYKHRISELRTALLQASEYLADEKQKPFYEQAAKDFKREATRG